MDKTCRKILVLTALFILPYQFVIVLAAVVVVVVVALAVACGCWYLRFLSLKAGKQPFEQLRLHSFD